MKKVIVDNIMNMEFYLLTPSECKRASYLDSLPLTELWAMHDDLVTKMKGVVQFNDLM